MDLSNDVLYTKNNIYKGLNYEYRQKDNNGCKK